MIKLKPCPFCGGKAEVLIGCDCEQFGGYEVGYIICTGCRTEVYFGLVNEEQVAEHWNRRATDPVA